MLTENFAFVIPRSASEEIIDFLDFLCRFAAFFRQLLRRSGAGFPFVHNGGLDCGKLFFKIFGKRKFIADLSAVFKKRLKCAAVFLFQQ